MSCGRPSCACDHSDIADVEDPAEAYSMHKHIVIEAVRCINETTNDSAKKVFKTWQDRFSTDKYVLSDVDEELLIHIPFAGIAKLQGIIIGSVPPTDEGIDESHHPKQVKLFCNKSNLEFDSVGDATPEQTIDFHPEPSLSLEYNLKTVRFANVSHLTLFIASNHGADQSHISYIGLRGELRQTAQKDGGVVLTNYEAKPNPSDHKSLHKTFGSNQIM